MDMDHGCQTHQHPVRLMYLQMAKPNYLLLASQIAATIPGSPERAALQAQLYVFTEELTKAEEQIFAYTQDGYIEATPGYNAGVYSSYVGKYYNPNGGVAE